MTTQLALTFRAPGIDDKDDRARLGRQQAATLQLMSDGVPRTIDEVAAAIGATPAGAAARIRCLRQARCGGHKVERTRVGPGLFTYRLVVR